MNPLSIAVIGAGVLVEEKKPESKPAPAPEKTPAKAAGVKPANGRK